MLQKITTKGMLMDLCSLINQTKHLLNNGKDYQILLKYLIKNNFWWDDDKVFPTIKNLMAETNLSNSKVQRMIKQMYKDLVLCGEEQLLIEFDEVEYIFGLSYFDKSYYFSTRKLPFVPRVGENVNIPYFKNNVGTTSFYVNKIIHEFFDRTYSIYIQLNSGNYNKYWHIRKDEVEIKGELPWMDFLYLKDYELKKKLNLNSW